VFSANEVLDMAIRLEKNGEAIYRGAAKGLSDTNLSLVLEWMADEEARHATWFSKIQRELVVPASDPVAEEMGRNLLDNLLAGQSFSLEDVDFSRIDHIDDMIATLIEFEEDTILFYEMLEAFVQDEATLLQLKNIVAEEERHIEKLKTLIHRETPATADKQ
jgi:rubrerythrin